VAAAAGAEVAAAADFSGAGAGSGRMSARYNLREALKKAKVTRTS